MITSPIVIREVDATGLVMSVMVEFNNATRAIYDVTVHRDADCLTDGYW